MDFCICVRICDVREMPCGKEVETPCGHPFMPGSAPAIARACGKEVEIPCGYPFMPCGKEVEMKKLERQLRFLLELDKQKEITRQTYLADGSRKEGDAEHAWHMAVMVFLLADYANEKIDVLKAVKMALLHDVVEIDAGDTYAYDTEGNKTKGERERKAADRIYGMLPAEQKEEYRVLWEEFEEGKTPEAKFVNTLDKVQPLLLNHASKGKSWKEHNIRQSQILERNKKTHEGSETLWEYCRKLIAENVESGTIIE